MDNSTDHTQALTAPLALPSEVTIYTVSELSSQWCRWVADMRATQAGEHWLADAGALEQVDAAGLQLLVALGHSVAAAGASLRLRAPSSMLWSGCQALGLGQWLEQHAVTIEAAP